MWEMRILNTRNILRRTQARDFIESFIKKTCDGRSVCLDVYQSRKWGKWFVISMPGFIGWTRNEGAAFSILNNSSAYTLDELIESQQSP